MEALRIFHGWRMAPGSSSAAAPAQPDRVVEPTTGWWKYIFKGDAAAKALFVGASCGLCGKADDFEYGAHGLD